MLFVSVLPRLPRYAASPMLACALAGFSSVAHAQNAARWCDGTGARVLHNANGDVMVVPSWRQGYVRVCSLDASGGQTAVTNCAAWLATLCDALRRQASTTIYFNSAPTCDAMPTYSATPPVGYVMLNN